MAKITITKTQNILGQESQDFGLDLDHSH